jgi:6-phosphogluconolactonase
VSQLIIGAYTEELPHVKGVAAGVLRAEYDPATGRIGRVTLLAPARNPSYVALAPGGAALYAVAETMSFESVPGGGVAALSRDAVTGTLTPLGTAPSGGAAPAYVTLDPSGTVLLVANYEGGSVAAFPLGPDGGLAAGPVVVQHTDERVSRVGTDPGRQDGPHPHMVGFDPRTGDVLVSDLGLDAIIRYRLASSAPAGSAPPGSAPAGSAPPGSAPAGSASAGPALTRHPGGPLALRPGTGPRHLAFHPGGEFMFVTGELANTVTTFRRRGDGFELAGTVAATPAEAATMTAPAPRNYPAAVRVTPSGRHVLVSNRGADSVSMFRFDPDTAELILVATAPSGGTTPRDAQLDPAGAHLILANTDSHTLAVLRVDEGTPALRPVGGADAASPSSVLVVP